MEEVQIIGIGTEGGRGADRWNRYRRRKRYILVEEVQIGGRGTEDGIGTEGGRDTDRWKRYRYVE